MKECNSIGINEVAEELGGVPTFEEDNGLAGDQRQTVWGLPNGYRAIETNGEPIFEDSDQVEFGIALDAVRAGRIGEEKIMNCDRCKKEISEKMDLFTFAERKVCENCFEILWEEAGEAEMREEAARAALEAQSKLEAGW